MFGFKKKESLIDLKFVGRLKNCKYDSCIEIDPLKNSLGEKTFRLSNELTRSYEYITEDQIIKIFSDLEIKNNASCKVKINKEEISTLIKDHFLNYVCLSEVGVEKLLKNLNSKINNLVDSIKVK